MHDFLLGEGSRVVAAYLVQTVPLLTLIFLNGRSPFFFLSC